MSLEAFPAAATVALQPRLAAGPPQLPPSPPLLPILVTGTWAGPQAVVLTVSSLHK